MNKNEKRKNYSEFLLNFEFYKKFSVEMLRNWQEEVKAISLEKVKQAIEENKAESYTDFKKGVDK